MLSQFYSWQKLEGETFMVFFLWDRKLNQTLKIIKHSVIETYLSIWKRLICAFLMVWVCYNVPRWNNMPRWMSQCKREGPQSRRPRAPSGSTHTFLIKSLIIRGQNHKTLTGRCSFQCYFQQIRKLWGAGRMFLQRTQVWFNMMAHNYPWLQFQGI